MRNTRRLIARTLSFMLCVIYIVLFASTVSFAQSIQVPQVMENTYVYASEGILTSTEIESLNYMLKNLEDKTSIEFAVITTSSYSGMTIEDYAHDLFNTLRIGKAGKDNGILFLLSSAEGHARLEIGYGLEDVLTDSLCGRILDKYYVPNRDNGKTTESLIETSKGVLAVLGQKYGVELINDQEAIEKAINEEKTLSTWMIVVLVIVVLAIIFIIAIVDEETGSSSSSSSGGFFSSSSGGSFGGGFSGGGGASR